MNWGSALTFGPPFRSAEDAFKAKRNNLLGLCFLIVVQVLFMLFFWWTTISSTPSNFPIGPTPDSLLLLLLAVILYFTNSRVVAGLLLLLGIFELVSSWILKISMTGNYAPPGMALLVAVAVIQITSTVFKSYTWQKERSTKVPRSKWVLAALVGTLVAIIAGYLIPTFHFWQYTRSATLIDIGGILAYHDPLDNYGFDFNKTWQIQNVPLEYGTVELAPTYAASTAQRALVRVERWTPPNIAPAMLSNKNDFLNMVRVEANTYATVHDATVNKVALIAPDNEKINAAQTVYLNSDGSKQYTYYFYNRSWNRDTSKDAWFFWRVTADIPNGASPNDEAEFQWMIKTFRIDGFTVDSDSTLNIEETRESFADFSAALEMALPDLKTKIIPEANKLLQESNPSRSHLLEVFADINSYRQKDSSDTEVAQLESKITEKYGKCWGQPQGQCSQ